MWWVILRDDWILVELNFNKSLKEDLQPQSGVSFWVLHKEFHSAIYPESWSGHHKTGHFVSLSVLQSSREALRAAE